MKRVLNLLFLFLPAISIAQTAQLKVIVPMQYDIISGFSEGLSWAYNGDKWGVINMNNEIVFPFKYDRPGGACKNGKILIPGESAYYDAYGNKLFTYQGERASNFSEGYAVIMIGYDNYMVIDGSGKEVFKKQNQVPVGDFHDGLLPFYDPSSSSYGYVNIRGEIAIPAQYSNVLPFSEGLGAVANKEGKYGFINKTGAVAIPYSYDKALSFCEGYAWCETNGTGIFIDKYGTIKIKNRIMSNFEGGMAIVKPSSDDPSSYRQFGAIIINKSGNAIFASSNYDQTHKFGKDYFVIDSNDTWAVTNNVGDKITKDILTSEALFQEVNEFNIIIIKNPKNGKIGAAQLIDRNKSTERLPGESYAHYVERLARMGYGLK